MKPSPRSIYLFLLLFVGFFISGALTPSVSDDSAESNDVLNLLPSSLAPSPPLPVPTANAGSTAKSLLTSDENKYSRYLLAGPDGTIYSMDSQSIVPHWKLVTGSPFLHSKQAYPDMEYFIDFGDNGQLYEYNKAFGRRELNETLEELVHGESFLEGARLTFGSKETTLIFVNESNGEVFSRHRMPASGSKVGSSIQEKLFASRPAAGEGYIMLVRTDYSLSCIALPIDPTLISIASDDPLWHLSRSHISAIYIKNGLFPNIGDKPMLPSSHQTNIPVFFLPMTSKIRGVIAEDLMLPPASIIYDAYNGNRDTLMLPDSPVFTRSILDSSQSPTETNEILEVPDDNHASSRSANNLSEASKSLLGYSVADKLKIRKRSYGFGNPRLGERWLNDDTPSISQNLANDTHDHVETIDHAVKQNINEMLDGVAWILIIVILAPVILALVLMKFRARVKQNEPLNNLKVRQSIIPKKRKGRKAGNTKIDEAVNNRENVTSPDKESAGTDGHVHLQSHWLQAFQNFVSSLDGGDGRWVGKLFVSNSEIGRGSNGTVVLEGVYDGRPVAVKRLLRAHHDVAYKEIQNLIASDQHPNIVRWYGVEQDIDFVYISLERCSCSLSDLIQLCSDSSPHPEVVGNEIAKSTNEQKISSFIEKGVKKDLDLWRANGFPSAQLLILMRDLVAGLAHLHELGIIHRDMKPQNVLISADRNLNAKLSDMGISKRLLEDMSSLTQHTTGCGSSGWQAPEQLLHGRQTRAVDLFSLGCILFFCITKGKHPFGSHFERDSNIVNNRVDLFLVDHIPEAVHLLLQLLDHDPNMRPSAVEVLHHPFFWNSEMRLAFLRDTSDRIELENRENDSELLNALESVAPVAFGGKWGEKLENTFLTDMGRYRKYNFDSIRDLLRVIRNKLNHYRELPEDLQGILGPVPEGFDRYFSNRFPKLLIEVYKVIHRYCNKEDGFRKYFMSNLV